LFKFFPGNNNPFALKSHFILLAALALCSGIAQADIYRSLDPDTPKKYTNMLPAEGRWELYLKEQPALIREEPAYDQRRFTVDSHSRYSSQIQAAAMATNVEAALIRAVISVESGYNPSAVSRAGAVGLMQLMPETATRYNVTDRHDPEQNIHGGAQYLHDLLRMFNYDLHLTIAAYNAGEQAVMKYGNRIPPYRETLAYVPKVMKFYKRYSTGYPSASESGYKRLYTASRKKGTQTRVSRTYMANLVNPA
jgi:soluble lytic murein transglycosylase-like protein